MARAYSASAKTAINATAGDGLLTLLEITHSQLAQPIRVVNDVQDVTSNGSVYTAMAFRVTIPDDFADQMPRATLAVDNIGRELTQWLEVSNGGAGASVKMMQIQRSAPNTVEWQITLSLTNISITTFEVSGQLGFEDLLQVPCIAYTYRPETAPGVF